MWHDSFIRDMTRLQISHVWHDSFLCDMTHSYVTWFVYMWHASFVCDMTHSYVTWLIYMWHASFICDMPHSYVTWLIHTWHNLFISDMSYVLTKKTIFLKSWAERHGTYICYTHKLVVSSHRNGNYTSLIGTCSGRQATWLLTTGCVCVCVCTYLSVCLCSCFYRVAKTHRMP